MPDYKQVIHERLYLREPGTERFRKTSAALRTGLLALWNMDDSKSSALP